MGNTKQIRLHQSERRSDVGGETRGVESREVKLRLF